MQRKIHVDIVFIDLCKAFDKVPHRRLILKLRKFDIGGVLIDWLEAFLTNRQQRVVLGNSTSDWIRVTSRVPQGSVLASTLFAAFINDLPKSLSNQCKLYADDLKIIAKIESEAEIVNLHSFFNSQVVVPQNMANDWHCHIEHLTLIAFFFWRLVWLSVSSYLHQLMKLVLN